MSHKKQRFRFASVVLLVLLIYFLFSSTVAESWVLNTGSMKPGYLPGVRFLVHPFWFRNSDGSLKIPPERGDLVTIRPPYILQEVWYDKIINPVIRFVTLQKIELGPSPRGNWENPRLFKRIIGIPGDTVYLRDSVAYIKGAGDDFFLSEFEMSGIGYDLEIRPLPEGWTEDLPLSGVMEPVLLGEGEYFVLGDNRSASNDSRYWGPISVKDIRGKIVFSYWPLHSFGRPQ